MTRVWRSGSPVSSVIETHAGTPRQFRWNGELYVTLQITNQWRIDTHWWRLPMRRHYFKLLTDRGWVIVLYHDLESGSWYLSRLYD